MKHTVLKIKPLLKWLFAFGFLFLQSFSLAENEQKPVHSPVEATQIKKELVLQDTKGFPLKEGMTNKAEMKNKEGMTSKARTTSKAGMKNKEGMTSKARTTSKAGMTSKARTTSKAGKTLENAIVYRLTVDYGIVNFTGSNQETMLINGQIPAPTLYFEEGKKAIIYVTNKMDVETSIHWHGILLPNFQDGVSYLTTPPITPGKTHKFEFTLKQSGTYWYHSHTGLQEQKGLYGAIVVKPKKNLYQYDHDLVLVLSDWTDEDPKDVLRTLKQGNEWYALKKGSALSLWEVLKHKVFRAQWALWGQRMPGMDISDVYYNAFLINGQREKKYPAFKAGEKVRLRVINAGASTYFWLNFGGEPPLLISADGLDIKPLKTQTVLNAVAETYDFLVTIPKGQAIEFRATAQDGTGFAKAILGQGDVLKAPKILKPDPVEEMRKMALMHTGGHKMHHGAHSNSSSVHKEHGAHKKHGAHKGHGAHKEHPAPKEHSSNKEHEAHKGHGDHKAHSVHKEHGTHTLKKTEEQNQQRDHKTDSVQNTSTKKVSTTPSTSQPPSPLKSQRAPNAIENSKQKNQATGSKNPSLTTVPKKAEDKGQDHLKKHTANQKQNTTQHTHNTKQDLTIKQPTNQEQNTTQHTEKKSEPHLKTHPLSQPSSDISTQTFGYDKLQALEGTAFSNPHLKEIHLNLTGNMIRYVWSFNGRTLSQSDRISIKKGETLRLHLHNHTMMHHPMHLHGHFFRVLNGAGPKAPLKHTVDVPPMQTVVIEFNPEEKGDWFFHCHILYHMKSGMSRVFSHGNTRDPRLNKYPLSKVFKTDRAWFSYVELGVMSNRADLETTFFNLKHEIGLEGVFSWVDHRYNFMGNFEMEGFYGYFVTDFFRFYGALEAEKHHADNHAEVIKKQYPLLRSKSLSIDLNLKAGIKYLLPYFIELNFNIDNQLRPEIGLEYELLLFPWTEFFLEWEWTMDFGLINQLSPDRKMVNEFEWEVGLQYILSKNLSLIGSYSNHFSYGLGLTWNF